MSRVQISENFGGQSLTTQARPVAATVQAAVPQEDNRWRGLADVFAQGAGLADTMEQNDRRVQTEAAEKYAKSMPVSELAKKIRNGEMMPSQSPVFVGTVQHIWGVNSHEAGLRDIQSKLTTGELKFNSAQEADQYLTEWRNTTLAGQSKYAQAGFDKAYAQTRDKLMDGVTRQNDKQWVDNAAVQATDFLANSVNKVTAPTFGGSPQEAAKEILDQYQLMRHTMTLPEGARKGALQDMLTRLAGSGHTGVLTAMLDSKLEDIGSLRSFIGESKALTLSNQATSTFDGAQRQRIDDEALPWYQAADKGELDVEKLRAWGTSEGNKKYVTSAFINSIENANQAALARQQRELQASALQIEAGRLEADAQQRTLAAFREGRLYEVQGVNKPQVMSKSGELKDFDVDTFITKAGAAMTAKLPFEQQVHSFAANGLDHPDWKNQMQSGYNNLASIRMDDKGKPIGALNDQGKQAISLFRQLDSVNPEYTKKLVGDKTYERFADIQFLQHLGKADAEAASLAANADAQVVVGSDVDKLDKSIKAAAAKLVDHAWYQPDWVQKLRGENVEANTAAVTGTVRRYASLLVKSGMYGNTESALEAVSDYLKNPAVSAKVNGTLYLRSEMPSGPPSRSQEEWMSRYLDEVIKPHAKAFNATASDVRLEYDPSTKAYRAFAAGFPLSNPSTGEIWVIPRTDMEKWYGTAEKADVVKAAAEGTANQVKQSHEAYRKRLWGEVGAVQKEQGPYAMERYDGTVNKSVLEQRIFSKEAFEQITKDGNAGKGLGELMKLYPSARRRANP